MKIVALDISAANTGVAIGDGSEPPRSFSLSFKAGSRGQSGAAFARWLRDLLMIEAPVLVAFEAPLLQASRSASIDGVRLLMGLGFQAEVICAIREIECVSVQVQSWRKVFLGHGRPHNPKKACLEMCAFCGWDTGGSDDRADAMGVWAWAHLTRGNRKGLHKMLSAGSVRAMTNG